MSAIIAPSEEESYLLAILDAADGLDLAEFSWFDPESSDGCYRAWTFQWKWYTCPDTYQIDQGGRSTGKTVSITMRAFAMPFSHPGQKMLLTAPELNHLRPVVDAIEERLQNTRILREMRPLGKGGGVSRQPHWQCRFKNGTQLISRLPNLDGRGVKGQHVILIELDEAQNYPHEGWVEIVECLNRHLPDAMFRAHGVPKGGRDDFYEKSQDPQWKTHRPMAPMRPSWSPEERNEKINEHGGSRQNIDYKRNIYGEHGDRTNAVFVISKLMSCVDKDEASVYNSDVYKFIRLELEQIQGQEITSFLDIPSSHHNGWSQKLGNKEIGVPKGYSAFWGGMDVGVTNHPSEILIAGQRPDSEKLDIVLRIQMQRVNTDDQKDIIKAIFDFYGKKLLSFALDKTGVGFPLWDQMTRYPNIGKRIQGYNFSEKVCIGFEDRELEHGETQEDLAIMRNVVEASTDWLRNDYIDVRSLLIPWDKEVLMEFQGQTYMTRNADRSNPYGRKIYGGGSFHSLDAAKMLIAGKYLPRLEEMRKALGPQEDVLDIFIGGQHGPTSIMDPSGVVFL